MSKTQEISVYLYSSGLLGKGILGSLNFPQLFRLFIWFTRFQLPSEDMVICERASQVFVGTLVVVERSQENAFSS